MEGFLYDELQIYRGEDLYISEGITLHQPTLNEVCNYGEKKYWNLVHSLTAVGADMKFQLYDIGIDYTKISDFELFYSCFKNYSKDNTCIILGSLDFQQMEVFKNTTTGEIFLYDEQNDITIDEYTYLLIADLIRKIHGFKRNDKLPGNETTKKILIEDAREEYELNKNKEYHSQLRNLISTMVNIEGFKYNHNQVWEMKINAFMDAVKRISKIKNANILLQSGYSGYGIDLKEINKTQLDWLGELE